MSWIKAPSSKVLHIRNWRRDHDSTYPALCSTRLGSYDWVSERVLGERVCAHCARMGRWEALYLLALTALIGVAAGWCAWRERREAQS